MNACSDIHILYIENDPDISQNFKSVVESYGNKPTETFPKVPRDNSKEIYDALYTYRVDTTLTGEAGLLSAAACRYDLVAIDCHLHDLSGIDIARKLLASNPNLPLLMMAGKGHERLAVEAMSRGVVDYIIRDEKQTYLELLPLIINKLLLRRERRLKHLETERAMEQSEQKFHSLVSTSPVCIHEVDLNGTIVSMNPAGLEMMGETDEAKVCGLRYLDVPVLEDRARIAEFIEKAKQGISSRFEFQALGENGIVYYSSSFDPIKDHHGKVIRLMGVTEDITERKLAEKALKEARDQLELKVEERTEKLRHEINERKQTEQKLADQSRLFELALSSIDQGFVVWNESQRLVICNNRFREIFSIPPDMINPGTTLIDLLRFLAKSGYYGECDIEKQAQKRYIEILNEQDLHEQQHSTKTGRDLYVRRYPIKGFGRITTFTDVTDIIEREKTSQLLREAIETFSDSVILYNEKEQVIFTNDRYHEVYPNSPPKDQAIGSKMIDMLRCSLEAGQIDHPLAKSDPEAWLDMTLEKRREKDNTEGETTHSNGHSYYYKRHRSSSGGHIHIQSDITERKRDEEALIRREERLNRQIAELRNKDERMEAQAANLVNLAEDISITHGELEKLNAQKDMFFSIIAHDLKGPFNALLGFTSLLSDPGEDLTPEAAKEYGNIVHESAQNVFKLLENLLEWSLLQMGRIDFDPGPVDLNSLFFSNLTLFRPIAEKKQIRLICDIKNSPEGTPPLTLLADTHMVDTIIRNLINNAIKYTPELGEVVISARHKNDWVEIEVSDTGVGISDEKAARLFQLDKNTTTTGTSGETGTGLGLYLCKDFVERQGGHISLESSEGKGTKFRFKLPIYHDEPSAESAID